MGRRIKVTENNYLEVLARIQKICNKWKLLKHYRCVDMSNPGKPKVLYEHKSWGITTRQEKRDDLTGEEVMNLIDSGRIRELFKEVPEKFSVSKFVHANEHRIRKMYLSDPDGFNAGFYERSKFKPLIHLDLDASSALVIDTGTKVEFTSYGFIVYVMHGVLDKDKDTWYIDRFIIDRSNKIDNLEAEIEKRDQEWAADVEFYNQLEEEDLDYDEEEDWMDLVGSEEDK